ncbi:MAG: GMC oxidoreductase [Luteolibacter sp.]
MHAAIDVMSSATQSAATPEAPVMIVIGSGPAAIAATKALVELGHHVTILDVGTRLEKDRQEVVERMSHEEPDSWRKEDLSSIIGERSATSETVHSKLSYGSSYSFDPRAGAVGVRWAEKQGFNHSLAKGGLSNVWGSSLLPYRQEDINDWPVSLDDLIPHYQAVMRFVPGTNFKDGLADILPSYSDQENTLEPSRQGTAFLNDLESRKKSLRRSGIFFGRSRLAIRATGDGSRRPCAYCALCLSGCPYGLIYSTAQTLDDLIAAGQVKYLADHLVEKFEMDGSGAVVSGRTLADDAPFSYRAERVFVGAGVLPTAKIVLNSLGTFDKPIRLVDSQYFIYPLLRAAMIPDVETERMHTASQAFLEIDDRNISDHLVHLQIYGYSPFLRHELERTFLKWPLRLPAFRRHFLGRLLVAQGFIHSNSSGRVELTLKKTGDGRTCLDARIRRSRDAFLTTLKVGWKLLKQSLNLRAIPLIPGLKFPNPGSGYHSGGTFPMRHQPGPLETDLLGRLPGMERIHLVDASVLPSIPATSITLSVMANAHRIASIAGRLEQS